MKKLFKAVFISALVLTSASLNAQSINVGYVSTTPTVKIGDGDVEPGDAIKGITAGFGYDINILNGLGISTGLNYTYAWDKEKTTESLPFVGDFSFTAKSVDHYIDVPVRLSYTLSFSDDFKVFGFAGPKFVYAVAGKTTFSASSDLTGDIDLSEYMEDFNHYDKEMETSRFDIKAGLGAGVQFNNIVLKAGYDWGLLNQYTGDFDLTAKSNQFYVTLGWAF